MGHRISPQQSHSGICNRQTILPLLRKSNRTKQDKYDAEEIFHVEYLGKSKSSYGKNHLCLKIIDIPEMYLGLTEIDGVAVLFAHRIAHIEKPRFGFEVHTQTKTQKMGSGFCSE